MNERILVLIEGWQARGGALRYARALAERVDACLVVLQLLSPDLSPDRDTENLRRQGEDALPRIIAPLEGGPVPVEANVRAGDPWSEFCKFVATRRRFEMVIWACDKGLHTDRTGWVAGHWAGRIQEELACTVVVAHQRRAAHNKA